MTNIYISSEENAKLNNMQFAACQGYAQHEASKHGAWLKDNKDETVNGGQLNFIDKSVTFRTSWNQSEDKAVCVMTVNDGSVYEM